MFTELNFKLDQNLVEQKAKEFAEKAFLKELEGYYTGYNSPFREHLKEQLRSKEISVHFELPDVLQTINEAIDKEHEEIVEKFINSTVLSDLKHSLRMQPEEITFSEFLKEVMECDFNFYTDYLDDYDVEYSFSDNKVSCTIEITYRSKRIEIRLQKFDNENGYTFVNKPYLRDESRGILNRIQSYLLSLLISRTRITDFDVDSFEEIFENYND